MREYKAEAPTRQHTDGVPAAVPVSRAQVGSSVNAWSGAQRKVQSAIDSSPRQLAQRRNINSIFGSAALQRQADAPPPGAGLPEPLKSGIESLSGLSMEDVRLHQRQGRVTPTAEVGGTAGDVSGCGDVIQREIAVGSERFKASELAEKSAIKKDFYYKGILYGVLPAYDAMGKSFADWPALARALGAVFEAYESIWTIGDNARDIVDRQKKAQASIQADSSAFAGLFTTVGFEHEFAKMKDGPLKGVTHLELTRSGDSLPLTGLPWILETDAEDALELVSPPFAMPTVGGRPMPHADVLAKTDTVLRSALLSTVKSITGYISWGNLEALVAKLGETLHITFAPFHGLNIEPENLTPRTDLDALAGTSVPDVALRNISVGGSDKHGGGIDTQVNLATDLETLTLLRSLGTVSNDDPIKLLRRIRGKLAEVMPLPSDASAGLALFYEHLHEKLAGLFAVPSLDAVRKWQREAHAYIRDKAEGRTPAKPQTSAEFFLDASLVSLVKDATPLWVKDHLMSLAAGILGPKDIDILEREVFRHQSLRLDLAGTKSTTVGRAENYQALLDARLPEFNALLQLALAELEHALRAMSFNDYRWGAKTRQAPGAKLFEHDSGFVGARQDTYLDPQKVQQQGLWPERRLHVVEIRKGNAGEVLEEGNARALGRGT